MKGLDELRESINDVDKKMADLFCIRMGLCKEVGEFKKKNSIPVFDANREEIVIKNNLKNVNDEELKPYYVNFINSILHISKEYQKSLLSGLKIAYSGIEGSYGYIASKNMYPNCELISKKSFSSAFKSVESGECDRVVLPIENSFAGDVGEVMDLIFQGSLYINSFYDLEVEHSLLGKPYTNLSDIKIVISHPQAIEQCSKFINENGFETMEEVNTAFASKRLNDLDDKKYAVIASKENAKIYGLEIIKEKINNSDLNTTRFAALSNVLTDYKDASTSKKNFILVFTVKNTAGSLAKCLDVIGVHGFNMRNLKSRPLKNLMWQYYFFCEIEGDLNSQSAKQMLTALKPFCDRLKVAGSYLL